MPIINWTNPTANSPNGIVVAAKDGSAQPGIRIAGLTLQAGTNFKQELLLKVGNDNQASSSTLELNPVVLSDLFCRVGGPNLSSIQ